MTVLVAGGGITGLTTAYALGRAGVPTLLVERSGRLGGKVRTEEVDGLVIEHGPDSFVTYRPAGLQLCRELGLADAVIRPREPRTVLLRSRGRFIRFPEGMCQWPRDSPLSSSGRSPANLHSEVRAFTA